jgi:hypothetical protein
MKRRRDKEKFYADNNLKLVSIECELFNQSLKNTDDCLSSIMNNLGFDVSIKKHNYDCNQLIKKCTIWTEAKIIDYLNLSISKIGRLPTRAELEQEDKGDLIHAIRKYGGWKHFKKKLGLGVNRWKWTERSVIQTIQQFVEQHGYFPQQRELPFGCRAYIYTVGGGLRHFKSLIEKECNHAILSKDNKITKDAISHTIKKFMHDNGYFPKRMQMSDYIKNAVARFYGGFDNLRKAFDVENNK